MINIENLYFSYDRDKVLKGIHANIESGVLCGLFGPNGSGKTTLFKCCLNFLPVRKGKITANGKDIQTTPVDKLAREIAFVPQDHKPPFPYKVKEVVLMGRTPHLSGGIFGISKIHKEKSVEAMHTVQILHLADIPYNQLSGGQRQLVLIARAIAQETPILFLDEPTSALDFHNQIKIWEILQILAQQGRTIVACTHDPNHVAWFCDRVLIINEGVILANDSPQNCLTAGYFNQIYEDRCYVTEVDGVSVILPKTVVQKKRIFREVHPKEG
ncbi:MAG: ABC transporter ATP-binding protein [Anaerolineaceae bacterium]|nr:ABC transporter ATP-binding protein [Anaerolineaceae bacterium]